MKIKVTLQHNCARAPACKFLYQFNWASRDLWLLGTTECIYKTETYKKDNFEACMHEESGFIFYLKDNLSELERILD